MTEQELREAEKLISDVFSTCDVKDENDLESKKLRKALQTLLSLAQLHLSARSELPERKNIDDYKYPEGKDCAEYFNSCLDQITPIVARLKAEINQLRVKLAGCGVAALGYASGKNEVKKGDYGYSVSYQDAKDLWDKYIKLKAENEELRKSNEAWLTSQHTWHLCSNPQQHYVKPYPKFLCSMCRDGEDFKALDKFKELQDKISTLESALKRAEGKIPSIAEIEEVLLRFGGDYVTSKARAIHALLTTRGGD